MNQRPAQQYIQADVLPPDPASVDWRQKRWQFKLYTEGTHILLPYHGLDDLDGPAFTLGQIGELLADLYGLIQQYYHLTKSRETQLPEFSLALRRVVPSGGALFPG